MRNDRRDFLKTAAAVGAGTVVAGVTTSHANSPRGAEIDAYSAHLGSEFTFSLSNGNGFKAKLTEVNASSNTPAGHRHPFSLVFTAADGLEVPQEVYSINHPQFGHQQWLITPVDGVASQTRLEAVFG
ncbi:twin-arginine translocation signal domain-containing protein [Novipirellula maiorica]|nr:twin-arginine translocation signal domain-containing protein [Rhodopirellula maiorica]